MKEIKSTKKYCLELMQTNKCKRTLSVTLWLDMMCRTDECITIISYVS